MVALRRRLIESEQRLLLLLKSLKEKRICEDKYLTAARAPCKQWVAQLSQNEAQNLLLVIAEVV